MERMQHPEPDTVLIVPAADVCRVLTMPRCIEAIDQVMRRVSQGKAQLPLRNFVRVPGGAGLFGAMTGCIEEPLAFGAKLISVFPRNADRGLPSHNGVVLVMDPGTGRVRAIMDGTSITAIRTAAATAVATRALARPDSRSLAILGAGEQAVTHLEAMTHVLELRRVRIWARSSEKAQAFAASEGARHAVPLEVSASVREAVDGADVICAVTAAREPILRGEWLAPGTHVNLVGASQADSREADDEVVRRGRYFVDLRLSAVNEAGELLHAIRAGLVTEQHLLGEIGAVLDGRLTGRRTGEDITIYKSLGIAAQDLAAAHVILDQAARERFGIRVRL